MEILQRIKETGSTNLKQELLTQSLSPEVELLLRVAYDDQKFGLSTKILQKVFNINDLKGYEDIGHWLEVNFVEKEDAYIPTLLHLNTLFEASRKKTGNNLIEFLIATLTKYRKEYVIWVSRALLKDMRIGMSLISVNKVFKAHNLKPIDKFIVQLCSPLDLDNPKDVAKLTFPCYCETKYDGTRTIAQIVKGKFEIKTIFETQIKTIDIKLTSRNGKDSTLNFPEIIKGLEDFYNENKLETITLDGEIISRDFNSLQHRLGRKVENLNSDDSLKFIVFDIIELNGELLKDKPFKVRRELLEQLKYSFNIKPSIIEESFNLEAVKSVYFDNISKGEEGIIVKLKDSTYAEDLTDARKGQFKIKPNYTLDLKVVGATYGTGKYADKISSLDLENKDGTIKCNAGSGITDIWKDILTDLYQENKLIGHIAEIKYFELLKEENGVRSLRFPIFVTLRYDKNESD